MENLCAIFLDKKGGVKRMPWRKMPVPLVLNDEENNNSVRCKMYGSLTLDRTRTASAWSHASNKEAPKEQSERFQADSVLNLTNSSSMERDRTIPLCCGGSANSPAIRTPFPICCNNCANVIPNTHWHCSICDDGDFDLCANSVKKKVLYNAPGHCLIKWFLDGEKVLNSTTETLAPKKDTKSEPKTSSAKKDTNIEFEKEIQGAFTSENKATVEESSNISRTCQLLRQ